MMRRLLPYLVLPADISAFERQYLQKITRVALFWFVAHIPAMMIVAALAKTSIVRAFLYTSLVVAGPAVARRSIDNPRVLTKVFAFAAMCLSGLLVHFGQGSMQIEMHFHFFVSIALLTVFADPLVIIVAAATAAVHHLALWIVLPSSVFNYEASIWAVVVHALFVIFESVAACFVARSFFDNVIGLDRIVQARTAELAERTAKMRLVLDNVDQGLVVLDREGKIGTEHSSALDALLGSSKSNETLWSYVENTDPAFATNLEVNWTMIAEDTLPLELVLDQLPKRLVKDGRTLELRYKPLVDQATAQLDRMLVVVSDVTPDVERERAECEQREAMALFEKLRSDRNGVIEFHEEAKRLIETIKAPNVSFVTIKRAVHTLKGNSGLFGLMSFMEFLHDLETRMEQSSELLTADRDLLFARFSRLSSTISTLVDNEGGRKKMEIDTADYDAVIAALRNGESSQAIATRLEQWHLEPVETRLARLGEYARQLAERLGKAPLEVKMSPHGVRLTPGELRSLWSSLMHVVRNAVDHGIEAPEERVAGHKESEPPTLELATRKDGDSSIVITIKDNGRGIDWNAIKERAAALGLPCETQAELEDALFADGVSTRADATEFSGRGIGMAAVLAECERVDGSLTVASAKGKGTTVELRVTPKRGFSSSPSSSIPASLSPSIISSPPASKKTTIRPSRRPPHAMNSVPPTTH
jgi:two-component system, chemotaxis family, sensor kinase CheA